MGNCISSSNITSQVAAPIANHDRASAVYFPPEIWRAIASVSTADSVVTLRQVSDDMRQAIDGLQQTDLTQINQHADSTVELYQSDDGLHSVTKDPQAQFVLARDENISPALQAFFAQSNDRFVRWALAGNPSLTSGAVQRLAQDDNLWVRESLAGNPSLTSAVQQTLAGDPDRYVRQALAHNHSLTSETAQQTLAGDPNKFVREDLARNPSLTSDAAQQRLAQSDDPDVRRALAGNPSLTPRAREILEQHGI